MGIEAHHLNAEECTIPRATAVGHGGVTVSVSRQGLSEENPQRGRMRAAESPKDLASWVRLHVDPLAPCGEQALAWLLGSYWAGRTVLPLNLGLRPFEYDQFVAQVLRCGCVGERQRARLELLSHLGESASRARERAELRAELAAERSSEVEDVERLLIGTLVAVTPRERRVAKLLALGCLGSSHLWSDLGLRDRGQLKELIAEYFPEMVRRNNLNMRWKRFFYRQLCEQGGDYLCRAPSCSSCPSYRECFAVDEAR